MDSIKLTTMRHVTDDNKTEGVSLRDVQPAKTVGSDAPTRSQQIKCGNSLSIRQEIQRFESVHPSIYAVYDMLELISDPLICQQIREQIVCIEDSFVNSQEWTLSRVVQDLRVGIVGHVASKKSALVHHYLTGVFVEDESAEGGRFKKEVNIDGQSYMLLIRDEGGCPEVQFSNWVDAVIVVFSLDHEPSLEVTRTFVNRISHFRHTNPPPFILVGTSDSSSSTHVIHASKIERLKQELNCSYFEASAANGSNVGLVFREACCKIIQSREIENRPRIEVKFATPTSHQEIDSKVELRNKLARNPTSLKPKVPPRFLTPNPVLSDDVLTPSNNSHKNNVTKKWSCPAVVPDGGCSSKDAGTPSSTPTTVRKAKRKSNIFPNLGSNKNKVLEEKNRNGEWGVGRSIPVYQGYLHKKSSKALNKDWKKKYATITNDGVLTYHPTMHDYMSNVHGKDIPLKHTTVKIPGNKFRLPKPSQGDDVTPDMSSLQIKNDIGDKSAPGSSNKEKGNKDGAKKKHRRNKSNLGDLEDSDLPEFTIVSLQNKEWRFEAETLTERDAWVSAIEQQILNCLQCLESDRMKMDSTSSADEAALAGIRGLRGNQNCADCDSSNPGWACINLGTLVCIECSGIHRNLGSHISKVRSLDLDDWPPSTVSVMMSLGNYLANQVWEATADPKVKPKPSSSHEEKNSWIRQKYEDKKFLTSSSESSINSNQQLTESIIKSDIFSTYSILASRSSNVLNGVKNCSDLRSPLNVAAAHGNLAIVQLLLWAGIDCKSTDANGLPTPLKSSNSEIVKLLKAQGCIDEQRISSASPLGALGLSPHSSSNI